MSIKSVRWPVAILDIGSNSVRFVVYARRNPTKPFFNEKVLCLLGRNLNRTGRLNPEGKKSARLAIGGFLQVAKALGCGSVHAIATAAIRDARDGHTFVQSMRRDLKAHIRIITADQEARYSALGVLSYIPEAEGIVADLGGGSLELAHITNGRVYETMSFPLGTLRLYGQGRGLPQVINTHMAAVPDHLCDDLPLYAVGGTGRAIAAVHSQMKGKNGKFKSYCMSRPEIMNLRKKLQKMSPVSIRSEEHTSEL